MYICKDCGAEFEVPATIHESFQHAFGVKRCDEDACPKCRSRHFAEAAPCGCGGWKGKDECVCSECRRVLLGLVNTFCASLGSDELAQIDRWLEGASFSDHQLWEV